MKAFIFAVFVCLFAQSLLAQGLERNTTYNFDQVKAYSPSTGLKTEYSNFTFEMRDMEMFYSEEGKQEPVSIGKAYFLQRYPSDGGGETFVYQLRDVKLEFTKHDDILVIAIVYGNKSIAYHKSQPSLIAKRVRNG